MLPKGTLTMLKSRGRRGDVLAAPVGAKRKTIRRWLGLIKPVKCATCHQHTRQKAFGAGAIQCLSCMTIFANPRRAKGQNFTGREV